ncbi:hypothetical protein TeGR_g11533 [Tetraparma gracilis]|uniref:MORN repeat-containing protein n=1 Tax=Tetraparma gracilis TaxID=2962635 RepID=A0ABQ6MC23_9STRA|nr:hypothetical protein TeGR_g11533 [Tetraparma gracilis]
MLFIRQPLLELASALCSEVTAATRAGQPVDRSWHFIIMNIDMIILAKDPEHRTYSRRDMDARVKDRIDRFKAGEIYELFTEYYDAKLSHRNTQQEVDPETEKQRKTRKVDRQVRQGDLSGAKATLVSTEKRLDMASSQLRDMFDAKLALPRPYNDHPSGLPPEEDPSSQPLPSSASRRTSTPGHFDDELDEGLTEDLRSRREKTTGATEKLIRCLRRTKWDKAPGVFGDSMNFWKTLGTFKSPDSDTETYAAELTDYLLLFAEGLVDDSIAPFYTLAVPAAFDKNPPGSAEVKLRPIGIPGALRRIVGKFVMALNLPIIAKYLTGLGQFAIGTLNGCGYICQYVALAFETMIDRDATNPEEWLSEAEIDELPEQIREDVKSMDPLDATKAYSSADLTSMFNVINRDELLRILDSAEAREALLPFKNYILLCYPNGQKSVYCGKHSEGFWWAAQIFGFIQGDPIASACASIVEAYVRGHLVGTHVRKQLAHLRENPPVAPDLASTSISFEAKAAYLSHRRQHRVEQTTLSSLAYMDDSSWINSYQVHVWAARRYNLLAPHYGLFENQQKAAYLLGKVDTHWREYDLNSRSFIMGRTFPQLLERDFHATQEALNAQGIKLLGNAIGSEIGRKPILDKIVTSTMQKVKLLEEYSIPFDSSFAITKFCFGGSINYILPSARNDREARALAYRAYEIMTTAVTYLTHTPSTDPAFKDSFEEMCLPHEFGGSGLSDPRNTYKASLVAARLLVLSSGTRRLEDSGIRLSACDVIHGAPLARDQHKFLRTLLPPSHDPDDVSALIPSVRLAATLLRAIGDKTPFLDRIRHGDKSKLQHELDVMRGKAQFARIMNDSRTSNPPRFNRLLSISQKCSGATLAQLDQTRKRGDYSREDFKFRYHLPIFDFAGPPTACPLCDKNGVFDRFGEHVFRCDRLVKSQRTRLLHNPLRNVTALGLARLSRVADSMITRDSVRTEPLNLLATKPNVQNPTTKRPADVLFHLPAPLPLNMVDAQRNPVFVNQIALDIKTYKGDLASRSTSGVRSGHGVYHYTSPLLPPPRAPPPPPAAAERPPVEGAPIVRRERPPAPKALAPDPVCFYKYSGSWRDGVKDGRGRFTLGDHSVYEGDFLAGEITGTGVRTYADGRRYEGGFLNGERAGHGVAAEGGARYEGTWASNRREGRGRLEMENGDWMEGLFRGHRLEGEGRALTGGVQYSGGFSRGSPAGFGVGSSPHGRYEGLWRAGSRDGQGRYSCAASGISYAGEFAAGLPAAPPRGLLALFDAGGSDAAPDAGARKPAKPKKGKKGAADAPDLRPELGAGRGGVVPPIAARCVAAYPPPPLDPDAEGDAEASQPAPPTLAGSTTSLALAPAACNCESGRAVRLTVRLVDAAAKAEHDKEPADVPAGALPAFVRPETVPFLLRLPDAGQVAEPAKRFGAAWGVEGALRAFYAPLADAAGGAPIDAPAEEASPNNGGARCFRVPAGGVATPELAGGGAEWTAAVDFLLPAAPADDAPGGDDAPLLRSEFLTVALAGGVFQVTTPESSWSLPPPKEGVSRGEWHSLAVAVSSGIPALVFDGVAVSGGSEGGAAGPLSPARERAEPAGGGEPAGEPAPVGVTVGGEGTCVAGLGVWGCRVPTDVLVSGSAVYAALRARERECEREQKRELGEWRARRDARARWEEEKAAGGEAGEEPGEAGEEPAFVPRCGRVDKDEGLVRKTEGGEALFENLVMPEGAEPGQYAVVVEDVSGGGGDGTFEVITGVGVLVINVA